MKEIKYLSHLSRNMYMYFLLCITLDLIFSFPLPINTFLYGLLTFSIAYAPVYFFNDFSDWKEDVKYKKANLIVTIHNAKRFWILSSTLIIGGLILSLLLSKESVLFLLILYFSNYLYSFKPFRLRDQFLLREITIFIIYAVKLFYVASLIHFPLTQLPLPIIIMSSATAALAVSLYKRHIERQKLIEYLFGSIFFMAWLTTILVYKQIFFLFFPLVFAIGYLYFKYKDKQIPIGQYQTLYFFYTIFIWIIFQKITI